MRDSGTALYLAWLFLLGTLGIDGAWSQTKVPTGFYDVLFHTDFKIIDGLDTLNRRVPLSEFIILDFGTTSCSPCLQSYIKLDSLQKRAKGEISIYMVTPETRARVLKFKKANPNINGNPVPIITDDTILHSMFEHHAIPHIVWINTKKGTFIPSSHHFVTLENVNLFVQGKAIDIVEKDDKRFDYQKGLFTSGDATLLSRQRQHKPVQYISGYLEGIFLRKDYVVDSIRNVRRYSAYNYPIIKIYTSFFKKVYNIHLFNNQIELINVDPTDIIVPPGVVENLSWVKLNSYTYTYELSGVQQDEKKDMQKLKSFLDHYFGMRVYMEPRKVIGWYIKPFLTTDRRTNSDAVDPFFYTYQEGGYDFCKFINSRVFDKYLFQETNMGNYQAKIAFNADVLDMDFKELKTFLELQNYTLEARETTIDKIIFEKL